MSAAWTTAALCAQIGGDIWFPETGGTTRPAKRICARCPVRAECLEDALENYDEYGIRGGLAPRARRKLHQARGAA